MAARASAEPLVWVSLVVGIFVLPLYLSGTGSGTSDPRLLFASAVLAGSAAFGFGSALLVAAYSGNGMHPVSVLAAALGALIGGLFAALLAAGLDGGLRIFAFAVLLVAGTGIAAAPRAWQYARNEAIAPQTGGKTGQDAGRQGP